MKPTAFIHNLLALACTVTVTQASVQGFDISNYQSSVDFSEAYHAGARFVIIKASRAHLTPSCQWFD